MDVWIKTTLCYLQMHILIFDSLLFSQAENIDETFEDGCYGNSFFKSVKSFSLYSKSSSKMLLERTDGFYKWQARVTVLKNPM